MGYSTNNYSRAYTSCGDLHDDKLCCGYQMTKQLYLRDLILLAKAGKKFKAWQSPNAIWETNLFAFNLTNWSSDLVTEPWTCEEIREPEVLYRIERKGRVTAFRKHRDSILKTDKVTKFREVMPGDDS